MIICILNLPHLQSLCPREKLLYSRHIYFTDFSAFGCDVKYFNLVGQPGISCFILVIYFSDEGSSGQICLKILFQQRGSGFSQQPPSSVSENYWNTPARVDHKNQLKPPTQLQFRSWLWHNYCFKNHPANTNITQTQTYCRPCIRCIKIGQIVFTHFIFYDLN